MELNSNMMNDEWIIEGDLFPEVSSLLCARFRMPAKQHKRMIALRAIVIKARELIITSLFENEARSFY